MASVAACVLAGGVVAPVTPIAIAATPTTTALVAAPTTASTNQPVTLTATVTGSAGKPSGSVAFLDAGTPIAGCGSAPLSAAPGHASTASCMTAFGANGSPRSLTARYSGNPGHAASSTRSPLLLRVTPGATSTTLTASGTQPPLGASVTYTATVVPALGGAAQPYGVVDFLDNGASIAVCSSVALGAGSATCTTGYAFAGVHSVTAEYLGDADFSPSGSGIVLVRAGSPSVPAPTLPSMPTVGRSTVKGDSVTVRAGCWGAATSCSVTARLLRTLRSRRLRDHRTERVTRTTVLARVHATIGAGQQATIRLTLNRRGRRLLARLRRLTLSLEVIDVATGRTHTLERRPIILRAPPRRR